MSSWKTKLYETYVTTQQSAASNQNIDEIRLSLFPQYRHIISNYLPPDKTTRIADLGCGYGQLLFCLKEMGYTNIDGVDTSSEQVEIAHRLGLNKVRRGDLAGFLNEVSGKYDVIFLMDVLEHMEKHEVINILELIGNTLSEEGLLIIHVPNAEGLSGMRIRYGDFTHETCFTPQSIRQVLLAAGFNDVLAVEEKPLVYGVKSLVRRVLWSLLTIRNRLLLLAETGTSGHILSQNMLVIAHK